MYIPLLHPPKGQGVRGGEAAPAAKEAQEPGGRALYGQGTGGWPHLGHAV